MDKFNIGDKVKTKEESYFCEYFGEEVGVVVGIDTREDADGKYLVKFDSLNMYEGWGYRCFCNNPEIIVKPYEGYAVWLDDIEKVEEAKDEDSEIGNTEETSHFIKIDTEKEFEDYILDEYEKLREQKRQTIKEASEKVLEITLEIKEIEAEIEKVKRKWNL